LNKFQSNAFPSNIVYFDNNQIKLEKADSAFNHPSQIPRPGHKPLKQYSRQDMDQYAAQFA
jgi:hypothetical protein